MQSFQATQYTHDSLAAEVVQPPGASVVTLSKDIEENKFGAVFKARGETAEDEADEVDKTKLLELSAKEVVRIGLSAVPTT